MLPILTGGTPNKEEHLSVSVLVPLTPEINISGTYNQRKREKDLNVGNQSINLGI